MQSRVQKWGNSLALRIPKSFATEICLADETLVDITLEDGKLVITPAAITTYSLEELLAQITNENLHSEQSSGAPQGNEVW
jgi:antitoxin MazE